MSRQWKFLAAIVAVLLCLSASRAESLTNSLKDDSPEPKSMGALTFGPEGILFVADGQAGTI